MTLAKITEMGKSISNFPSARVMRMEKEEADLIFRNDNQAYFEVFREEELAKLSNPRTGFMYFLDNYAPVFPKEGGEILPIELWPIQRKKIVPFLSDPRMSDKKHRAIPKTRQIGVTTIIACLYYWSAAWKEGAENTRLGYIAPGDLPKEFLQLIRKIDEVIAEIAPWVHRPFGTEAKKDFEKRAEDSAFVLTCPSRGVKINAGIFHPRSIRGGGFYLITVDEVGAIDEKNTQDPATVMQAVIRAISSNGQIILPSTGNGSTGKAAVFKDYCMKARAEENNYDLLFIPYYEHPEAQADGDPEAWLEQQIADSPSKTAALRENPRSLEDCFLEDPEGAAFNSEHIDAAVELGKILRDQVKKGGRVNVGIDWGDSGTGYVVSRELMRFGYQIIDGGTISQESAEACSEKIMNKAKKHSDQFGFEFYDPGGSGAQANHSFERKYSKMIKPYSVSFSKNKRANLDYIRLMLERTHKQLEELRGEDGEGAIDHTKMMGYLAIDPSRASLVEQLRAAQTGSSGGIKKEDEQHELDGLIASITMERHKWAKNMR